MRFPWDARSTGIWRPPAQLRTLRHDGVGLAFAVGAKAAKPEAQVHLPTRRRLIRPERDGGRHRGAPQAAAPLRDQPQRRLDRRSRRQQARPLSRLHPLRERWPRHSVAMPNMSKNPRRSARPCCAWKKVEEGMVGFVNVKTDYRARATTVRFPAARPERPAPPHETGRLRRPVCLMRPGRG